MIPKFNKTVMKPEEFFGKLFTIRTQIHLRHLKVSGVGSYAEHKALNDFYEEILDLTDGLIESYQGKYGLLNIISNIAKEQNSIEIIEDLMSLTDNGIVYNTFKESWIKNQLDEISMLGYSTLYKLKNLK